MALEATAQDRQAAALMGINTERMFALGWGIGSACVGVAGAFLASFFYVFPYVGSLFGLIAYVIVALGGFGSIPGSLAAGIIIGLIEVLGGLLIAPAFKYVAVFLIYLIVVLHPAAGPLREVLMATTGSAEAMKRERREVFAPDDRVRPDGLSSSWRSCSSRCSSGCRTIAISAIKILLYAMLAQAWNILAGYCGQISLGHAVFFGAGAYTSSVLQTAFGVNPVAGPAGRGRGGRGACRC